MNHPSEKNSNWKGGKPKCEICNKILSNYDNKRCNKHRLPMSIAAKKKLSGARKGKNNPMHGRTLSEAHKKKLSILNSDRRGIKNPNWRGTTPLNKAIREFPESRALKVKVFIRDNRTCQVPGCLSRHQIQAHHIKSISEIIYENQLKTREDALSCKILFDEKNLVTLCESCHKKTKNYGCSSFQYFVDNRGIIKDIFVGQNFNGMTEVTFEKGSIRGNHKHPLSTQQDFIADGLLLVAQGENQYILGAGETIEHLPGVPHAYKAIVKSRLISFFSGIREGKEGYESDTIKLSDEPLL